MVAAVEGAMTAEVHSQPWRSVDDELSNAGLKKSDVKDWARHSAVSRRVTNRGRLEVEKELFACYSTSMKDGPR